MTITKEKLMEKLKEKFPLMWMKDGIEFSGDYENSIWTGEGSMIVPKGWHSELEMFDYYESVPNMYVFGVHKELSEFLDQYELFAEAKDPGTYFIFIK